MFGLNGFCGQVQGDKPTPGLRHGEYEIESSVQSWSGSINTKMYYNQAGGLMVRLQVSQTSNFNGTTIFEGTFEEFIDRFRV